MPLKNWQEGSWPEGAQAISGQVIHEKYWVKDTICHACPIGCGKAIEIKEGPYAGVSGEGPEYETLGALGTLPMVNDLEAVIYAGHLCNVYGMDTISTGATLARITSRA